MRSSCTGSGRFYRRSNWCKEAADQPRTTSEAALTKAVSGTQRLLCSALHREGAQQLSLTQLKATRVRYTTAPCLRELTAQRAALMQLMWQTGWACNSCEPLGAVQLWLCVAACHSCVALCGTATWLR